MLPPVYDCPRCCHRCTTLYCAKVEDRGIRCCYHGWLLDPEGRCLEMPCEPGGGSRRGRYRQPWYPVQEYLGFVFAYLGPPDRKPCQPRYDVLGDVPDGWRVLADTDLGVKSHQDRVLADGSRFHRVTEIVMPTVRIVASPFVEHHGRGEWVAWTLPI